MECSAISSLVWPKHGLLKLGSCLQLVDDGDEKLITLTEPELIKVLADQVMALLNSFPDKSIPATELLTQFMKFHGHSLQLQDFGVHNVIALMKKVKHVARVSQIVSYIDRSDIGTIFLIREQNLLFLLKFF